MLRSRAESRALTDSRIFDPFIRLSRNSCIGVILTITVSGSYRLAYDSSTGEYSISPTAGYTPIAMHYEETPPVNGFFSPNDLVIANESTGSYTAQETYIGSFGQGFVTRDPAGFYFLNTSDSTLPPGTVLELNLDPFPVCFTRGTLIATPEGAVPIESLTIGAKVIGSKGIATVKWIGWRKYGAASLMTAQQKTNILPVRVRAHAIADDVPNRDLLVSPWHHLLVDGMLVRANDLVNGTTITQETSATSVDYYHVELEEFDVILAHGMYSESWADGGNRDFFQNVDVTALRPEDKIRRRAPRPGFDHLVLRKGKKLEAIQARVSTRAETVSAAPACAVKAA